MSTVAMTPFQQRLKSLMNQYVHYIYSLTRKFPKEELFGAGSQIRRAALSVILNFIEGFTRLRFKVKSNAYEISYGSLHESSYLLEFARDEHWITHDECKHGLTMADEIGAMLWSEVQKVGDMSNRRAVVL